MATVELSAVNRKQLEWALNLPHALEALEPRLRDALASKISRGRVNVRITIQETTAGGVASVRVNRSLAKAYADEFASLARDLGLAGNVTLDHILRVPGVLQPADDANAPDCWYPVIAEALQRALAAMMSMREKEGDHLALDLQGRVTQMKSALTRVRDLAPQVLVRYREQLRERIQNAGFDLPSPDDERLLKEVVLFADRSDISEEIARLDSHFAQFDGIVKSAEPVGRTLDFLAQEMHREINTIGSKANDSGIAREVVMLKTEVEKFREQAQNVE